MYEKLGAVAPLLENLGATLSSPDASVRVGTILAALDETAQQISNEALSAQSGDDRAALHTIYRGMLAAKRIVARLHELAPL